VANESVFVNVPILFFKMIKKVIKLLLNNEVTSELSEDEEKLKKIKITNREFDEFTKLYFKMCSPNPEYRAKIWPKVVKIKKEIMTIY